MEQSYPNFMSQLEYIKRVVLLDYSTQQCYNLFIAEEGAIPCTSEAGSGNYELIGGYL